MRSLFHPDSPVMQALTGTQFKGREVRCNGADDTKPAKGEKGGRRGRSEKPAQSYPKDFTKPARKPARTSKKRDSIDDFGAVTGDWRELMKPHKWDFKDKEPDFTEEGWAIRKPRKKK